MSEPLAAPVETWLIEPRAQGLSARLREVWRYRRMFLFFAARATQKLYQRTILGRAWLVLRPIVPLLARVFLFGSLLNVTSGSSKTPYFLFVAVGTAAWDLFASCAMWATRSLELNTGTLSRIYVPRLILPPATMVPGFIYFAVHVAVIVGALIYFRLAEGLWYVDTTWLFVAPVAIVLIVVCALALGLFTAVIGAGARDVRFGLGYVLEFWFYLTPVVWPLSIVAPDAVWPFLLNPLAVLVIAFRGALLGGEGPAPWAWATALAVIGTALAAGLVFFFRAEAEAVDSL